MTIAGKRQPLTKCRISTAYKDFLDLFNLASLGDEESTENEYCDDSSSELAETIRAHEELSETLADAFNGKTCSENARNKSSGGEVTLKDSCSEYARNISLSEKLSEKESHDHSCTNYPTRISVSSKSLKEFSGKRAGKKSCKRNLSVSDEEIFVEYGEEEFYEKCWMYEENFTRKKRSNKKAKKGYTDNRRY